MPSVPMVLVKTKRSMPHSSAASIAFTSPSTLLRKIGV